jgi:ribosomal protein L11 methyltransferase
MYDPLGYVDRDDGWECYFSHAVWADEGERIRAALSDTAPETVFSVEIIDRQNWNRIWEETIRPIRVSEHFIVHPSWHAPEHDEGCTLLVIDPKMSFGTGFHETTRLMLKLLETCAVHGARVLDVGTGTGILAIAAIKLGASHAVGVDIDEWSRQNAEENAQLNGVSHVTAFRLGTLDEADGSFDIILSNITRLDNLELLPRFTERLNSGGTIILSGYHGNDAPDMRSAVLSAGYTVRDEREENEWSALMAAKEKL